MAVGKVAMAALLTFATAHGRDVGKMWDFWHRLELPMLEHLECYNATTSVKDAGGNLKCMTLCEELGGAAAQMDSTWNSECRFRDWTQAGEGQPRVPDSCWSTYVYGYSENKTDMASWEHWAATPAMCQYTCQMTEECMGFVWNAKGLGWLDEKNDGDTGYGWCSLMSFNGTDNALSVEFDKVYYPDEPATYNSDYCPEHMDQSCFGLANATVRDCLKCDDTYRCVYKEEGLFGGPKFCPDSYYACQPNPDDTTTTTAHKRTFALTKRTRPVGGVTVTVAAPTTTETTGAVVRTTTIETTTTTTTTTTVAEEEEDEEEEEVTAAPQTESITAAVIAEYSSARAAKRPVLAAVAAPATAVATTAAPATAATTTADDDVEPSPCSCNCHDECHSADHDCHSHCKRRCCGGNDNIVVKVGNRPKSFKLEILN